MNDNGETRAVGRVELKMIPLGFLGLIIVGALMLWLPWARVAGQSLSFLDALFMATSSVCVTGLSTVNVATQFNLFGQAVLLGLIQLGGLGILTAGTLVTLLRGRRLSLAGELTIQANFGKLRFARPLKLFWYACGFVLVIEAAGALALYPLLRAAEPGVAPLRLAWDAVFHAVSAFCNAGLSTFPDGLARYRHEPLILTAIDLLVFAGGIGLITLINLRYFYFWRRDPRRRGQLALQAKLSLITALFLLIGGTVFTLICEGRHTLAGVSWPERLSWSLFHSTVSRTAGFNVVDLGEMHPATLLGTMFLMFVGGAPGSMAGGIKTVTFAILVATALAALRRQEKLHLCQRDVPRELSGVAVMIGMLATTILFFGLLGLMFSESGQASAQTRLGWLALAFEAVSAFGTAGLSTGVTPALSPCGKLTIIALMFVGRVGPLMLAVYFTRPAQQWHVRYPTEELSLG